MDLGYALKEWAVTVHALEQGETILLLRKGGIRETGGQFTVPQRQVWLYPTYEHQRPELLKPLYAQRLPTLVPGCSPTPVRISSWAEITRLYQVTEPEVVEALFPFHIGTEEFARERWHWKPRQPLSVLLLRVYRLVQAVEIAYYPEYSGCMSWIDLKTSISTEDSKPAIAAAEFVQQAQAIEQIMAQFLPTR